MTCPHSAWFKLGVAPAGTRDASRSPPDSSCAPAALRKEARDLHGPGHVRRLEEPEAGRYLMTPPLGQVPHLSPESFALPIDTCTRIAAGSGPACQV